MNKRDVLISGVFGALLVGALFTPMTAIGTAAIAPTVAGDWQGTLDTDGGTIRIVLHISEDKDGKLTGAIASPGPGCKRDSNNSNNLQRTRSAL
jgi:hypothetical protein